MESEKLEMNGAPGARKKKRPLTIILLLLLIVGIGGGGAWYYLNMMSTPIAQPTMSAAKPRQQAQRPERAKKAETRKEHPSPSPALAAPAYGNLEEYAALDAKLKTLEKKVQIQSKENELQELVLSNPATRASRQSAKPEMKPEDVRQLIAQEMSRIKPEENSQNRHRQDSLTEEHRISDFVSIQGVGKNLTIAVHDEHGGIVKLKVGSAWRGGTISKISRSGVTVRRDGQSVYYPF